MKLQIVFEDNTLHKIIVRLNPELRVNKVFINSLLMYLKGQPSKLSFLNELEVKLRLHLSVGNYHGEGYFTTDGKFVLKAGANVSPYETKSCPAAISKKRKNTVESALLKDWITTEDMLFSSSSAAASFILGYPFNGPKNWKNSEGICVGELRKNN